MPTFEKAEAVCFAEKRETRHSDGRAKGWRRAMNRYVLPKIGAMPVDKVGNAAVYEVLRPIALAGKHSIVKVAGTAITAVLEWARIAEFRAEGSPMATVRRRLPKRVGGPKHYDALHFSEVAGAPARIDATNCAPSTKWAMRFTALTASRQVEVRRATWEQFDLEGAVWVKPAQATKTAKIHRVPLSRQALAVLAEARKGTRGALVFPGARPGAMMGDVVMTQALRNAGVAALGHGFRSRFLMDETELRQGRQRGDGDGGCRLHGCCGVISRLIRDVGGGRDGAIVSASVPWDTETLGDQLVGFLHAGGFDVAKDALHGAVASAPAAPGPIVRRTASVHSARC